MIGFEKAVEGTVSRLIRKLDESKDSARIVGLGEKLRCFALDISALVGCGQSFGCTENGASSNLMNVVGK
jgi:hypothetical protein